MNNMDDKVDMIERIRLSGEMVVYHVLEEDKGKHLFDKRPVSETNEPYDILGANQFEADEFALLLKKWRNERFGCKNLGNVAITKQDFNNFKHYSAKQTATAILQRVYGNDLSTHTLLGRCKNGLANRINSDVIEEIFDYVSKKKRYPAIAIREAIHNRLKYLRREHNVITFFEN